MKNSILLVLVVLLVIIAYSTADENICTDPDAFPTYYDKSLGKCYPCDVECGVGAYVAKTNAACNADSAVDSCSVCGSMCSSNIIWPCLSGMRRSDSSRCLDSDFMKVWGHRCPQDKYLTYVPSIARFWQEEHIISVNPTSTFFALSQKSE
jgi:hypothetical protein